MEVAAPETILGEPVDGRADLYSLACVGFWLLTGRKVFQANSPGAMLLARAQHAPPRPGTLAKFSLPAELDQVRLDYLAKEPAARPSSADELAQRLEAVLLAEAWTQADAASWCEANRPVPTPTSPDTPNGAGTDDVFQRDGAQM
jgi:hypothetical protein